jgi:hypothetical protein
MSHLPKSMPSNTECRRHHKTLAAGPQSQVQMIGREGSITAGINQDEAAVFLETVQPIQRAEDLALELCRQNRYKEYRTS